MRYFIRAAESSTSVDDAAHRKLGRKINFAEGQDEYLSHILDQPV